MMKSLILILVSGCAFAVTSFAQNTADAVEYMQQISAHFDNIAHNTMSYTSAASHGKSARKIEKRRAELISSVTLAEAEVRKLKPFNGDRSYRDSVVSYLRISKHVLNEDYDKILNLEEIAEQSYDAMEAYLLAKEKADEKLEQAFDVVKEQQQAFALRNNIKLIEGQSKLGAKLEKASAVYNYYNRVYLLFFKSYKDEAYYLDAQNREDVNAMEQTRQALQTSAKEGLAKLASLTHYKGDNSLKQACLQMLNFYQSEAANIGVEMNSFIVKKADFEKIKAAFDAKRPNERTKEDINAYNKAVNDFNASIARYNGVTNDLNKKRSALLNQWNSASKGFLDQHVPRY
ncbi:MAG TPA: hypothetical protein DCE81_04580 [Cytophagales bacterium]|nr:hypothetical protein [Cytophagales bacterium]